MKLPSLRDPPVAFADVRPDVREGSIAAFERALERGAAGIECGASADEDGVVRLHGTRAQGKAGRRERGVWRRQTLTPDSLALRDLYEHCGTAFELCLNLRDGTAVPEVIATARDFGEDAEARLWLSHDDCGVLATWRPLSPHVLLVDDASLGSLPEGPERRAAQLRNLGIDAVRLHHSRLTAGTVTLFHRFDRLALASGARFDHVFDKLLQAGIDGITSDRVDELVVSVQRNR